MTAEQKRFWTIAALIVILVLFVVCLVGGVLFLRPTRTKPAAATFTPVTPEPTRDPLVLALATNQASQSTAIAALATSVAQPTPTPLPPTNTPKPAASPTPTITPTATPTATSTPLPKCEKHGQIAWQNDNQTSGELYGVAPVGGLDEPCGVVGQTWTDLKKKERFVFYIPPYTVVWISGYRGGTGWYFDPTKDVQANLEEQAGQLLDRDGPMPTYLVKFPTETFRLVTRIQSESVVTPTMAMPDPRFNPTPVGPAGKCNIGGESVGPAILEGNYEGVPTVIKLTSGHKLTLNPPAGCWKFPDQADLDRQWPIHIPGFLARYPKGSPQGEDRAIEK